MQRAQLEALEALVMEEVVRRRKLGGYNADAVAILMLCETVLRMIQHLVETSPPHGQPEATKKKKN